MIIHRLEFNVEEIDSKFKDDVRRKIVRMLRELGLDVLSSNIKTIEVD